MFGSAGGLFLAQNVRIMDDEHLKLKIHEGTGRLTGQPLCFSCTHFVRRGDDMRCAMWGDQIRITKPIYNCNKYYNASLPTLHDMKEVAWELKTKGGRVIGFHPPKERATADQPPWDE